eukprot:3599699-Prymnesium_polylepis.1
MCFCECVCVVPVCLGSRVWLCVRPRPCPPLKCFCECSQMLQAVRGPGAATGGAPARSERACLIGASQRRIPTLEPSADAPALAHRLPKSFALNGS